MYKSLWLFFSVTSLVSPCDETCIQTCLASDPVTPSCFSQCACDSPSVTQPFGHSFETETGAKYRIQELVYTEYDWVEKHYGCDVTCASFCYGNSHGNELVSCFDLCGCRSLLLPDNDLAVQTTARTTVSQGNVDGAVLDSVCVDHCNASCLEDREETFSKCFYTCAREACAISSDLTGNSRFPDEDDESGRSANPLILFLICVGIGGVYLYKQKTKDSQQVYKSL